MRAILHRIRAVGDGIPPLTNRRAADDAYMIPSSTGEMREQSSSHAASHSHDGDLGPGRTVARPRSRRDSRFDPLSGCRRAAGERWGGAGAATNQMTSEPNLGN